MTYCVTLIPSTPKVKEYLSMRRTTRGSCTKSRTRRSSLPVTVRRASRTVLSRCRRASSDTWCRACRATSRVLRTGAAAAAAACAAAARTCRRLPPLDPTENLNPPVTHPLSPTPGARRARSLIMLMMRLRRCLLCDTVSMRCSGRPRARTSSEPGGISQPASPAWNSFSLPASTSAPSCLSPATKTASGKKASLVSPSSPLAKSVAPPMKCSL